ncbi:MAG TPA: hypothetical protein VOA64_18275 [Candidatus Dormibacteraeota bacterium]|nr:hypothetical protein [Candidatus Dormibacteraeota bacterium]
MASPQTSVSQPAATDDLLSDERWQLVRRIVSSTAFQKSTRLRDLLQYVTEQTIHGHAHDLTEQHIGNALFHKPSDYSPLEDSSVRVHARQLRLKLHEYFNEEGHNEPLILDIPKGSYAPVFRTVLKPASLPAAIASTAIPVLAWRRRAIVPWALCGILTVLCAAFSYRVITHRTAAAVPGTASLSWPSSQIFDARHQTIIVVADSNYGMSRILTSQPGSLDQYLRRDFLRSPTDSKVRKADIRLSEYISNSTLTSFADVADVVSLFKMAGALQSQVSVRYPRDLRMRDLDHNNYIFIGSPGSNPWVTLLQDKLNFRESETVVGKSAKVFVNKNPQRGEQPQYEGLRWTGTMGEDYATISLLPNATHDGSVLALQGLQQEGTEAAGRFLADEENRRQLMSALGISPSDSISENIWFEALIRSRTVSGAPNSTTLVAVRRIH